MWKYSDYYTLAEAYWQTGHALYRNDWTGDETTYRPHPDNFEIRKGVKKAQQTYERLEDKIRDKNRYMSMDMTDAEYNVFRSELQNLKEQHRAARQERDRLSETIYGSETNDKEYQRRVAAECRLAEAFSKEELRLLFNHGLIVEWNNWSKHSTFKVSFDLSLIYAPASITPTRRGGAYIIKEEFDNWLATTLVLEVKLSKTEGSEEFQAMRNWFKDWISDHPARGSKEQTQQAFEAKFKTKAKGTFLKLWKITTPKHWQDHGRPKSTE